MPAIYPSTALKNQQLEIKALADHEPVYITENGRGKYVFMSESVLEQKLAEAVAQAVYDVRMEQALERSRSDFAHGRYYSSREELMEAVAQKRAGNA